MTVEKLKSKLSETAWWLNIFCLLVIFSVVLHHQISQFDPEFQILISFMREIAKDPLAVLFGGDATAPNDFLIQ